MSNASSNMKLIKTIDDNAYLEFSTFTDKWYVSSQISISNGTFLSGVTEHRDYPDVAVLAFLTRIKSVEDPEFLVVNPYRPNRREYRWNGVAWKEIQSGTIN